MAQDMDEVLHEFRKELQIAEHSLDVSLKYTRTVDVIRGFLERVSNALDIGFNALLFYAQNKKFIANIPESQKAKLNEVERVYSQHLKPEEGEEPAEVFEKAVQLYNLLKRVSKVRYSAESEFRRNVTMHAFLEEGVFDITIDKCTEYFTVINNFYELTRKIVYEIKEEF